MADAHLQTTDPDMLGVRPRDRRAARLDVLRRWGGPVLILGLFILALVALGRIVQEFEWWQVAAAIGATSGETILIAVLLTAGSYLALTGYDFCALHYIRVRLRPLTVLFGAFTGYAVGNSLGFAVVSGGSVRYRIYTAAGLSPLDVGRVVAFSSVTFIIGISLVGGVGLVVAPTRVAAALGWAPGTVVVIAVIVAVVLAALVVFAAFGPRHVRINGWLLDIPSVRLVAAQILLSTFDIVLSAGVLYMLLPGHFGLDPFAFLAIYAAAMIAGLLSHLPGGIGIFDSIILFGLAGQVDPAATAGALVLYRAIYYLLPLTVAGLLFGGNEVVVAVRGARLAAQRVARTASRTTPTALAVMTFVVGVVMLLSGSTPALIDQLRLMRATVPIALLEVSHLAASLCGVALLVLARGLLQRLRVAWAAAIGVLVLSALTALGKGFDIGQAGLAAVTLVMLLATRKEFYRRSSLADLHLTPGWLAAVVGAAIATLWVTQFAYQHVVYTDDLWWRFSFYANAPRGLRSALVVALAVAGVCLWQLLKPSRIPSQSPREADLARVRRILSRVPVVDGHLALLRDKSLLFGAHGDGFLMYGQLGATSVALGDPVGPPVVQAELVWRFREQCARLASRPVFYQLGVDWLPIYIDAGLSLVKIGEEARISLPGFTLEGPERAELRRATRRAQRAGLVMEVLPPAGASAETMDELRRVSDSWLATHEATEKRFSIGWFDERYLSACPLAIVRENGRISAFANLWPGPQGTIASLDLVRYDSEAHADTMAFLFAEILAWCRGRGYVRFDLGMTPLAGLESHPLAPVWRRIGTLLFPYGSHFEDFDALRRFNDQFRPDWQPRYLACDAALTPAQALVQVAILVNGGTPPHRPLFGRRLRAAVSSGPAAGSS